ncbi:AraC family transcriptional regulator [Streptomyces gibsoniae]|uniref:AraC family transcriptional regulator n=1 Tax=Streptomyces gibsoniae TaxID=3075529 RepID=A0ABU2U958_9ACTN|nr:AraC family transcriptional regulator [Streptomyces sp. DSM 41699]MDT0469773.1 AraC family transcriptional regulator [Streptomyces sp. DSM 41699]
MDSLNELRDRIARLADGTQGPLSVEGMTVLSADRPALELGTVIEPLFALVAQGTKRSVLGDRVFDYGAGQYLVVTVDLPLVSQITQASPDEPLLALGLPLKPQTIAELLLEAGPLPKQSEAGVAIATSDADSDLLDAAVRLFRLQEKPDDFRVLAPAVVREIHWRLLTGPQGALVRRIGLADSRLTPVSRAVRWLQTHYDQAIRIDDLAGHVGLSVPSLNRHFRAVTALSPLQYQKQIRLQKARLHLMTAPHDVAAAGYAVGYDSPSQFSREYRRMFGAPPSHDAEHLQTTATIKAFEKNSLNSPVHSLAT